MRCFLQVRKNERPEGTWSVCSFTFNTTRRQATGHMGQGTGQQATRDRNGRQCGVVNLVIFFRYRHKLIMGKGKGGLVETLFLSPYHRSSEDAPRCQERGEKRKEKKRQTTINNRNENGIPQIPQKSVFIFGSGSGTVYRNTRISRPIVCGQSK